MIKFNLWVDLLMENHFSYPVLAAETILTIVWADFAFAIVFKVAVGNCEGGYKGATIV